MSCSSVRAPITSEVTPGLREQPGVGHLRERDAVGLGHLGGDLDDVVEPLAVVDRRLGPLAEVARGLRVVLAAAELAREQAARDGLHTRMPRPWSTQTGTSSFSASRACSV